MIKEPLENFQCIHYIPGNLQHEELLESYMKTTDVENNNSRKNLKLHLYDGKNGVLFLIVNSRANSIDLCTMVDDKRFVDIINFLQSMIGDSFRIEKIEYCNRILHTYYNEIVKHLAQSIETL